MKIKYCVIWRNQLLGQNKDSIKEFETIAQCYSFIRFIEKVILDCGYKPKFKIIKV